MASEATKLICEQNAFRESIRLRVANNLDIELKSHEVAQTVELIFHTVHRHFVEQGLLLAAFLQKKIESLFRDQIVEDEMIKVIDLKKMKGVSPQQLALALQGLRGVFYTPTADESSYLTYLCRTSLLCTTLNVSPRLLEYFNQMGGDFRLFIGTDLLVKAISESFLEPDQQQVTNILKIMAKLGAKLMLAEPILVELFTHLHGVDLEFNNHHLAVEQYVKDSAISECDRILIRTYYYAKKTKSGPRSWFEFM